MWFLGRFCKSNRKVGTWRQQRGRSSTSKGPMIAPIQVRSPNDALKSFFEERTQTKSWNLFRSTILGTSAEWESRSARKVSWREIGSFAPPNLVGFSFFIHVKTIFFLINRSSTTARSYRGKVEKMPVASQYFSQGSRLFSSKSFEII